jgi:5'-nucleotidase
MNRFPLIISAILIISSCKSYPDFSGQPHSSVISMNDQFKGYPPIDSLISPYKKELSLSMDAVVGYCEQEMYKQRPEGLLGNAIADVVFEQLNERSEVPCDLVLLNHGGLRAPIGKGDITVGRVYEVMPFDNQIAVVELDGQLLKKVLRLTIQKGGDPISNARVKVEAGDTLISIAGKEIQADAVYRIATSDYMANGGDSYSMFKEGNIRVSDLLLRNVIMDGIKHRGTISSKLDGRFVLP